ncbi:PH domain-containing protein [Anaerosacchariphilus polymeriproducens]|uniref:YdbS-like PH domain-containing protein n=1 Tax=Anaerosacchariphilus polymeriproducens TaxID=1812858 RepID=A0A371AVK8_9FIRM|nr:PH domain-containing protein [Anaerosacchariphilus polymeriproducens]RDU23615.1 hypothetical protein DWV06_08510 [Anaerosacchariphilus polymeriproducens]
MQDKKFLRVEKKAMIAWRISRFIGIIILALFLCGLAVLNKEFKLTEQVGFMNPELLESIIKIVGIIWIGYSIIGLFLYPWIEYCQWGYQITEDKVVIHKGIFFLTEIMIPIVRIQHISMSQGPIFRALGLHRIEISVATSNFHIVGIKKETAEKIVESLKEKLYNRLEGEGVVWNKTENSDQQEEV